MYAEQETTLITKLGVLFYSTNKSKTQTCSVIRYSLIKRVMSPVSHTLPGSKLKLNIQSDFETVSQNLF